MEFGQYVELREHSVSVGIFKIQGAFQKGKAGWGDTVFVRSKPALDLTFGSLHFLAGFFLGELAIRGFIREVVTEGQCYVSLSVHDGGAEVFVRFTYN